MVVSPPRERRIAKVIVHDGAIEVATTDEGQPSIRVAWSATSNQRRREVIVPAGADGQPRPMKTEDRSRILKSIAKGRGWLDELVSGRIASTETLAVRERCSERSIRMTLSLAFLSPEIGSAIIAGRLPRGIGLTSLADLPPSWVEQHDALGI